VKLASRTSRKYSSQWRITIGMEYLSIKEGSFLVCFDCHIEISQAMVPLAV